jgi:hypothetical protein
LAQFWGFRGEQGDGTEYTSTRPQHAVAKSHSTPPIEGHSFGAESATSDAAAHPVAMTEGAGLHP